MPVVDPLLRHRLSVEDFQRMGSAGILTEGDRIELIEGELIDMAPIGSEHAGVVNLLNQTLTLAVGRKLIVGAQNPVVLGKHSQPQPDIMVLKPREDFYRSAHPRPEDVLLLIEVSDSTVRFDRDTKIPLYARYGVPEVWLLDLQEKTAEVYRAPQPDGSYRQIEFRHEGVLVPERLPDVRIDLKTLF